MEKKLLSALVTDRSTYSTLRGIAGKDHFSDMGWLVYKEVASYYDKDPDAREVDKEILSSRLSRQYPKHADLFSDLVSSLVAVSAPNIMEEFIAMCKLRAGNDFAQAILAEDVGRADELIDKYSRLASLAEDDNSAERMVLCGADIDSLCDLYNSDNLVPFFPSQLNDRFGGGAPKGSHVLYFGVPEMGKTLTAVNLACGQAHAGYKVLYVGNEEPIKATAIRIVSRFSGLNRMEVLSDRQTAHDLAMKRGYSNIVLASLAPGCIADIAELIDAHSPDVVILDQLTNLSDGKKMGKTERFEHLAYQYRMLVKRKNVVGVSFCQADDDAQGKAILDMNNVYFSNTGIPAQCDAMVGLGGSHEDVRMNKRWLSLPKNKLGGDHNPVPVSINPLISKMVGV